MVRQQRVGTSLTLLSVTLAGSLWLSMSPPARAVLIQTATGTDNTTAPPDDPGWANVGERGIGNGVYLGDRWVLTVAHVGDGGIVLDGATYSAEAGSAVQLTNGGAVFARNGSAWELAGMIFGVRGYSGQPSPAFTAVFGNATYSVDLAYYRPQIMAIVPEPTTAGPMVAPTCAAVGLLKRRRSASAPARAR
jgi:hypothetical protein